MSVEVRLLGRPRIWVADAEFEPAADRRSALLYYLAHAGGWVPREDLLFLFWPDFEEHKARANLRQLLVAVRETPYAEGLEVEKTRVRFPVETDLERFQQRPATPSTFEWPGPFLAGFRLSAAPEFEAWLELERTAWHERFRSAILSTPHLLGDPEAVAEHLDSWLSHSPLDEEVLRARLDLAARTGQRSNVLARFAAFEARLMAEFGTAPEPETLVLVEHLRDPSAATVPIDLVTVSSLARSDVQRLGVARHFRGSEPALHGGGDFVGRDQELHRLAEELGSRDGTVVTLLAPGGMGKTRLALESATRLAPTFRDGAVVVPLLGVDSVAGVVPALAQKLGLMLSSGHDMTAELLDELRGLQLLVVLDNVEQIEGIGVLVEGWSRLLPEVAWLCTSRVKLGIPGESVVELSGLPYPRLGEAAEGVYPAVELLLSRARRAGKELDPFNDGEAIRRVTSLTAGMPLAIELAAGWLRVLPLAGIADELSAGLDILEKPDGSIDPRHANLRSVFNAAWTALRAAEQDALLRLSVFRGGFDVRAASEVAGVGRPLLLALRNRSMLTLDDMGRLGWHPLLETYLTERAADVPEVIEHARTNHARYYMDLLTECDNLLNNEDSVRAVITLTAEHANIEAAWARAVQLGWWNELRSGGAALGLSYENTGRPDRWYALLRHALVSVPPDSMTWGVLEVHHASREALSGLHAEGYRRRAAVADRIGPIAESDLYSWAWVNLLLGQSAWKVDRPEEARIAVEESIRCFTRSGRHELLGMAYANRIVLCEDPSDYLHWSERLEAWKVATGRDGNDGSIMDLHAAFLVRFYGEYGNAIATLERELELQRASGWHRSGIAILLATLATVHAEAGHFRTAVTLLEEYFEMWRESWLLHSGRHEDAVALRAHLGMLLEEPDFEASILPGSKAASTTRGLLLRSGLARQRGELGSARDYVAEALTRMQSGMVGLEQAEWRVRALLSQASIDLCDAQRGSAQLAIRAGLDLATSRHMLPSLLHCLATAVPLLSDELAGEVDGLVVGHPAAPFEARRRWTSSPLNPARRYGSREEAWLEAATMAGRVANALAEPRT